MNGREAVIALMQGKKVRRPHWRAGDFFALANRTIQNNAFEDVDLHRMFNGNDWEIVAEPLTDEQLIAEWERCAREADIDSDLSDEGKAEAYRTCIRQLRERKL